LRGADPVPWKKRLGVAGLPLVLEFINDVGDHRLAPVPFLAREAPQEVALEVAGVRLDAAGFDDPGASRHEAQPAGGQILAADADERAVGPAGERPVRVQKTGLGGRI